MPHDTTTPPRLASEEEVRATFNGAAVHSNRMFLTKTGAGVRLSFMEQMGELVPPQFRAAVIISYQDALELRDLISRQLQDIEGDLKDFVKSTEKAGSHG